MKMKAYLMVLTAAVFTYASPLFAGYFEEPPSSPILMHVAGSIRIGGEAASVGDEVGVFDQRGSIVGHFVVEKEGIFGDMTVSGDYAVTPEIEGSVERELLSIKVWQSSTETEYSGSYVSLSFPEEGETIYTPYPGLPLRFEGGVFYLLNIDAGQ